MESFALLLATARRDPSDDEAWLELAREADRGATAPREDLAPHLETLEALLSRYPDQDGLRRLWSCATAFALADPEEVPHGSWWADHQRLGEGRGHAFDRVTGRPLAVRPTVARAQFLWVPPGSFWMGTPDDELEPYSDQGPRHEVTLAEGFFLQRFPMVLGEECTMFSETDIYEDGPGDPCRHLSWDAAVEFVTELTLLEWEEGLLPRSYEYRLPTEAEWEYAARAGDPRPWYGPIDEVAWCGAEGPGPYPEVGEKRPNALGLHDMLGLVGEWCQDRHHTSYDETPRDGSAMQVPGPDVEHRVFRGGNIYSPPGGCTVAYRHHMDRRSHAQTGARLVLARAQS